MRKLSRILSILLVIGAVKVSLLVSLLIFPETYTSLNIMTITKAITGTQEKKISEEDMRLTARLQANAQNTTSVTVAENKKTEPTEKPQNKASTLSFVNEAQAAENTPPSPNPAAATPNPSPLVPKVKPMESPLSAEKFQRPDSLAPEIPPAPNVQPYTPQDSVQRKQEELNRREQELLALQQQMESRMGELKGLEGKLENLLTTADKAEGEKLTHLIDVYSNMKAKQAAEVLATLDEKIAVGILAGMRGRQAGEILTYMAPDRAAALSELLAKVSIK